MALVSSGQLTLTDLNDTKQIILYLNANYKTQIYDPTAVTYTPSFTSTNLVVTPELYIAGGNGSNLLPSADVKSVTWYEGSQTTTALAETATTGTTGAGYTYNVPTGAVASTAKPLTIKSNLTATQKYTCVIVYTDADTNFDITIKADVEIARVQNGAKGTTGTNAVTAFLTNSAVTLPATNAGAVSVFTGSANDIYVYDGTTALTFLPSGTAGNGQFTISASISPASGVTLPTPTAGTSPNRAVYGNITAMATANDVVTVTFTITGKSALGTAISATVVQTFGKVKQALDGTTPSTYWMTVSSPVVSKSKTNVMTPSTVTANGNMQTGTGAVSTATSFKWVVDTSTDGTTFTNNVATPTTATSATSPTITSSMKAVRFRMYLSTVTPSTTNFVDDQVVRIVTDGSDGNDGANAFYLNVWTPDGDTIRNGAGSLSIQADLYEGGTLRTPTAFKWYIQDPTATTTVGGDTDGGAGWRLLTAGNASTYGVTNYTTAKMTVTGVGIVGVEGFKCVATYTNKYSGVTVVKDFQDPISVSIIGGSIFKNGDGSVVLKAQLMQAGANIATTGYTFAWSVYNMDGSLKKTLTGTTDTITVQATDIDGRGNVVCDVSK